MNPESSENVSPFVLAERRMLATASAELPALLVADAATRTLGWVLHRAGFDEAPSDPPPARYWRARALLYLGTLTVRTARAGMLLLAVGYGAESLPHKRMLLELHSRAQHVVADPSGEYARQWLQGRAGKPARAVAAFSPGELWETLSHTAHADHRAVENFLAVSHEDGSTGLVLLPERRAEMSNGTLAMIAGETRDVAMVIAREHGLDVPLVAELDAELRKLPPYRHDSEPDD